MTAIDIFDIKAQNVKRTIDAVRFKKSMTKKDIADATLLSFATVSNLCNELLEKGILTATKKEGMTVGRTPSDLTLNSDRFNVICINLQKKNEMNFAILNLSNKVVFQKKYSILSLKTPEEIIVFAKAVLDGETSAFTNSDTVLIGVGVAVSSVFDANSGLLINCAIDMFTNVPLKEIVERVFGLPAYVDNEANLCALSLCGQDARNANIVYLYVSQGVGVGINCQGKLLRGTRGYAAEVAHLPIGDMNLRCSVCGNYGCVENELAVGALLDYMFGEDRNPQIDNWLKLIDLIKTGDSKALTLARKSSALLGKLASVLVNLFDPSLLYIGGDIAHMLKYSSEPFCEQIKARCLVSNGNGLEIIFDEKSDDTINVGISEEICNNWAETVSQELYD